MSGARRLFIEFLVFFILGVAAYGAWQWQGARHERALLTQTDAYTAEITTLREKAEFWASAVAAGEAEAVFRAFQAGIGPAVQAGREASVELAAVALLKVRGVDFVHVLEPDGEVIYSSDAKLTAGGYQEERAAWALAAEAVTTRASATRGVTEIAAPIAGADGPVAYLWMGYRTEEILEETRPATLGAAPGP